MEKRDDKIAEKNVFDGNKTPKTTTGEMKDALGKLRDYLDELLGDDSTDKEAARLALGIDLTAMTNKIEAKADQRAIEESIKNKVDQTELDKTKKTLVEEIAMRGTPIGSIDYFATITPPTGYLKADGAAVGRETYPELFASIGTMFGEGDGSTTFNLPDLIDRFAQGCHKPGQKIEAGLPNITGTFGVDGTSPGVLSGAFYNTALSAKGAAGSSDNNLSAGFDASRSSPIYGASNTVQPPALTLLPCIKAFDAATNPGLIDITELANDVAGLSADKLDKRNNGTTVKYVTEAYNDGTNWYRKWSDGWLEQGGYCTTNGTYNFILPYRDTNYTLSAEQVAQGASDGSWWGSYFIKDSSATSFLFTTGQALSPKVTWYTCGQGI